MNINKQKVYTHDELVKYAARYLKRKHVLVLTEMAGVCSEEPDAIGWNSSGVSTLIECKANRNDFLSDKRKSFRDFPQSGLGSYRYYLINEGVATPEDLPCHWGLLQIKSNRFRLLREAELQPTHTGKEKQILLSSIRRIGQNAPGGMNIKFYTYQTKCKATMGVEL